MNNSYLFNSKIRSYQYPKASKGLINTLMQVKVLYNKLL